MIERGLRLRSAWAALGLVLLVAAVYAPVAGHAFVDFDDGEYVYENPQVLAGLSPAGVAWAFTTGYAANWHPLTWLSHMADVSLFGPAPGAQHVVNAAFHAANAVLLFLALQALTGAFWRSAAVAALFAVHPLNVQSVAWVAERKNVLSTLFWLLGLLAYAAYARRPSRGRMALVGVLLALGLMSKPMLVTFPLTLLVLDFWPLGRMTSEGDEPEGARRSRVSSLLAEKIPLVLLVAVSSAVTWIVQWKAHATASTGLFPLGDRIANAALSYGAYLRDAVWPAALSVFHPHPRTLGRPVDFGAALLCAIALGAVTFGIARYARRFPFVASGWAWYAITLVPVIGIVQVGEQAHADRYAYVPLIGIFVAAVWAVAEFTPKTRGGAAVAAIGCVLVIGMFAVRARAEVAYWKDGLTLYGRALQLDRTNWLAWNNLGMFHLARNEPATALPCFKAAVDIRPGYDIALYNEGVALQNLGRLPDALAAYDRALSLNPENADALVNAGNALQGLGRLREAIACYERTLRLRPDDAHALNGLVLAYDSAGDRRSAFAALERLRRVDPKMAQELVGPPGGR